MGVSVLQAQEGGPPRKSAWAAGLLEYVVPTAGYAYADAWTEVSTASPSLAAMKRQVFMRASSKLHFLMSASVKQHSDIWARLK